MVSASFFRGSFFRRIVIDHFRILDSGLTSWELQEYLVCAFSCGFRTFSIEKQISKVGGFLMLSTVVAITIIVSCAMRSR